MVCTNRIDSIKISKHAAYVRRQDTKRFKTSQMQCPKGEMETMQMPPISPDQNLEETASRSGTACCGLATQFQLDG